MDGQIRKVIEEFTKQAVSFNEYQKSLTQLEYTRLLIRCMDLSISDLVLEVAAGTCAFGRHLAPHVRQIVELDTTDAMLEVGRREGEKEGIANAVYVNGLAEELPFPDGSFDVVVSRLAFHHFADADLPFREMCRVLKAGGKLVVIDMAAREEALRDRADDWERLRDPSHVRCVSPAEFRALTEKYRAAIRHWELTRIPVDINAWMDLTRVPEEKRKRIRAAMAQDLAGTAKTGFAPYEKDGRMMFDQHWLQIIAVKE